MPGKTHGEKIDELAKLLAALTEQVDHGRADPGARPGLAVFCPIQERHPADGACAGSEGSVTHSASSCQSRSRGTEEAPLD